MQRLTFVVALAALGVSIWTAWRVSTIACDVSDARATATPLTAIEARVAALEATPAAAPAPPQPIVATSPALAPAAFASGDGADAPPATTLEEVRKRLDTLEATARAALGVADGAPLGRDAVRSSGRASPIEIAARFPKVYGTVDEAAKDLALTDGQKSDFERATEDARRELADLKKTPDADGATWEQTEKDAFSAEGGFMRIDMSKVDAFRERTVPGRSESFGAAARRIREQAKRRMRDGLTPEQRETFDKAIVDPLVGGEMGGFAITTATFDVSGPLDEPPAMR